jgi:hypothetical protein
MQQQRRQQQQRRRPLEPFEVPRSGAFYAHDDRGEEEPQATTRYVLRVEMCV